LSGLFLFWCKKESFIKTKNQINIEKILSVSVKEVIKQEYKWEVITSEGWKVIVDPVRDLEEQFKLTNKILSELSRDQRINLQYIGVDVDGQVYYK